MAAKPKRLQFPGGNEPQVMDPAYPVKIFLLPESGQRIVVVTDRTLDRLWKAFIAEDPRIHQLAATQQEAERQVIKLFRVLTTVPRDHDKLEELETAEDLALIRARSKERSIPWEMVKYLYGLETKAKPRRGRRSVGSPKRSAKRSD